MSVGIPRDLKKCRAVADTGIDGRILRRGHEQGADVLGFLYRQGIVTELEATSISHFSSTTCDLSRVCGRWVESHTASGSPRASDAQGVDRSMVQFGKGFLLEVLKPSISWRTTPRRSNRQSSKRCSSERSPYHSHGISSAILCNWCAENVSIRDNHGAKSSHDSIRS